MNGQLRATAMTGFLIFLFIFCFPQFVGAQYSDIEYAGSTLWTFAYATEIVGDYAFCVMQHGLMVLDISDLASPQYVDKLYFESYPEWPDRDIEISGSYAYIAFGFSPLKIVDISDPTAPILTGSCDIPGSHAAVAVSVSGDYAYVADGGNGLHIIGVADPNNPYLLTTFEAPSANGVCIFGQHAYVSNSQGGFQIVDVSQPDYPSLVWSYNPQDMHCNGVAVKESYAYLSSSEGLLIFDISTPDEAQLIGSYQSTVSGRVAVDNDYVFLGDYANGFEIIDVSDPLDPIPVYFDSENVSITDIVVQDTHLFITKSWDFLTLDISQPESPEFVGNYKLPGLVFCSKLLNDHAFVGCWDGLYIVDISDSYNPQVTGYFATSGNIWNIEVSGNKVYLAAQAAGLLIIDITDPGNPVLLGDFDPQSRVNSVFIDGDYAYLADYHLGLMIVDVSDPTTPSLVGSYELSPHTTDVFVEGEYAYVTNESIGLLVFDVTDPAAPNLAGNIEYEYWGSTRLFVGGNYAYVAARDIRANLIIIDVSDPANPILTSATDTDGNGYDVDIYDDLAFLGLHNRGLGIYDVTDPAFPENISTYQMPGWLYEVEFNENHLYLAAETGYFIFDFAEYSGCFYVVGDFNGSGAFNVADIVDSFSKLKTGSPEPAYLCECPYGSGNEWAVAMDVNNSCSFNVADVVAGFSYLKTGSPEPASCEDCPPTGR